MNWFIYCLIDSLIDWLIGWLIDWLMQVEHGDVLLQGEGWVPAEWAGGSAGYAGGPG